MCDPVTAIMAGSSLLGGISQYSAGKDEASQYKTQAKQILTSAKQDIEQTAYSQARNLSDIKAKYGKSGVAMTGSAADYVAEQVKQDEITLLNKKYNAEIEIKDAYNKSAAASTKAKTALVSGAFGALSQFDYSGVSKGIGIGGL